MQICYSEVTILRFSFDIGYCRYCCFQADHDHEMTRRDATRVKLFYSLLCDAGETAMVLVVVLSVRDDVELVHCDAASRARTRANVILCPFRFEERISQKREETVRHM